MYIIDNNFTDSYLKALKEFSKIVIERCASLPQSENNQLYIFFQQLHDQLARLMRRGRQPIEKISINPNIIFKYNNPKLGERKFYISLGGTVKFKQGAISEQSLCLTLMLEHSSECDVIPESWNIYPITQGHHILRRFHFDIDMNNDDTVRPKFHLQYGGNFESSYLGIQDVHYKLFSPLDHPRIPNQPYDIVMLLDFIIREFDLGGQEVINDGGWNKHLIEIERIWLKPYYGEILRRLEATARKTPLHRAI